jgi:AraC family transcriptional regulator
MFKMSLESLSAADMVEDFGQVCPEGLLAFSLWRGHQAVRLMQFRHDQPELRVPPLANALVMINLSTVANVTARINHQPFSRLLQQGESVIIPAGTASEWRCRGRKGYDMLHIYLGPELLREAAAGSDIDIAPADIEPEFGARDPHIHHLGLSLLEEMKCATAAGRAYVDLLAAALALHLLRRQSAPPPRTPSEGGRMPEYKLRRALDYISDRLGEELRVADIAEAVNVSPHHFTRLFKQAAGLAPYQYIMQKRIEMAKRLLVETEHRIARIALDSGFQSQSRFTTLFRRYTGTTPRAYRNQNLAFAPPPQSFKDGGSLNGAGRYLCAA